MTRPRKGARKRAQPAQLPSPITFPPHHRSQDCACDPRACDCGIEGRIHREPYYLARPDGWSTNVDNALCELCGAGHTWRQDGRVVLHRRSTRIAAAGLRGDVTAR